MREETVLGGFLTRLVRCVRISYKQARQGCLTPRDDFIQKFGFPPRPITDQPIKVSDEKSIRDTLFNLGKEYQQTLCDFFAAWLCYYSDLVHVSVGAPVDLEIQHAALKVLWDKQGAAFHAFRDACPVPKQNGYLNVSCKMSSYLTPTPLLKSFRNEVAALDQYHRRLKPSPLAPVISIPQ